jgi:hypothetical protein
MHAHAATRQRNMATIQSIQARRRVRSTTAIASRMKRTKAMKTSDFVRGIAYALAELNRGHDQPTMCWDVLNSTGFTLRDFERVVDPYDMQQIRKIWDAGRTGKETSTSRCDHDEGFRTLTNRCGLCDTQL